MFKNQIFYRTLYFDMDPEIDYITHSHLYTAIPNIFCGVNFYYNIITISLLLLGSFTLNYEEKPREK